MPGFLLDMAIAVCMAVERVWDAAGVWVPAMPIPSPHGPQNQQNGRVSVPSTAHARARRRV